MRTSHKSSFRTHGSTHVSTGNDPIPSATTLAAGLCPTLDGVATNWLDGTGAWTSPTLQTAYTAGATITIAGAVPVTVDDLAAVANATAITLQNSLAATAITVNQYAPAFTWQAESWSGGARQVDQISMQGRAIGGAIPALYISYKQGAGAWTTLAYFGHNASFSTYRNTYACIEGSAYHFYLGAVGTTTAMRSEHEYNTGYIGYIQGWQCNLYTAAGLINNGLDFSIRTGVVGTFTGYGGFAFDLRDTAHANVPSMYMYKFAWINSTTNAVPHFAMTNGDLYCNGDQYGARRGIPSQTEELTVLAAGTLDSTLEFPANSIAEGCAIYVTEAISGTATGFTVGITGDADLFATVATVTLGTTDSGEADTYVKCAAATKVLITFTGGVPNGTTGKIRIKMFHKKFTAPTS